MANDWLKELEAQLEQECQPIPKKRPVVPKPNLVVAPKPEQKQEGALGVMLFALVLGMVIAFGAIWLWKGNELFESKVKAPPRVEQQVPERQPWEEPWRLMSADVDIMEEKVDEVAEKQGEQQEKMDWIGSRLALLGALHSNNFVEVRKHVTGTNFLLPDRYWQIDRLPDNLALTEEDKERLGRFVKTEEN